MYLTANAPIVPHSTSDSTRNGTESRSKMSFTRKVISVGRFRNVRVNRHPVAEIDDDRAVAGRQHPDEHANCAD